MATPEIIKSWEITEDYLKKAKALLELDVISKHSESLSQFEDFLKNNEFGLAYDWLESIAEESQWNSIDLLEMLKLAAENMSLTNKVNILIRRINDLGKT